jgi:hypothetical protein
MKEDRNIDFIICGAAKSGTTSLHYYLDQHPDICFALDESRPDNEIHFFDYENRYEKGLDFYFSLFSGCTEGKIKGETTPSYIIDVQTPQRIHKSFPDAKLVFILRNPIERAYSQYLKAYWGGKEDLGFLEALKAEPERTNNDPFCRDVHAYINRSMYFRQISRYLELFDRSQFFFLFTEDLNDPAQFQLLKLQEFLGIKPTTFENQDRYKGIFIKNKKIDSWLKNSSIVNKIPLAKRAFRKLNSTKDAKKKPEMDQDARAYLQQLFSESNEKLAKIIKRDLSHWK